MKIDQYYQRQRCKQVEVEQFLACFRVARVGQRQLGFLVITLDGHSEFIQPERGDIGEFICGNIDLNNGTQTLYGLVSSCDWHTMQFLPRDAL